MLENPPARHDVRECDGCGAPIVFVRTAATGKWIPLDSKPERRMIINAKFEAESVTTWMPHHATCPNADEFRRK